MSSPRAAKAINGTNIIRQQIVRTRAQIATSSLPTNDGQQISALSSGTRKPMQIDLMMLDDLKGHVDMKHKPNILRTMTVGR